MGQYGAQNLMYLGDQNLRQATKVNRVRRGSQRLRNDALEKCFDGEFCVSYDQYLDAKMPRGGNSRLSSDNLALLKEHVNSFHPTTEGTCQVCGKSNTNVKCNKCNRRCCYKNGKGRRVQFHAVLTCMMTITLDFAWMIELNYLEG